MFLPDTNIVSELQRPRPETKVLDWIESVPQELHFLSVISPAEIVRGVTRHPDLQRKAVLQDWVDHKLRDWVGGGLIPVSEMIAEEAGRLSGRRDLSGRPISFGDAHIAATAIEHNLVLVTRNVKDFAGPPLEILNPWTDVVPHKA